MNPGPAFSARGPAILVALERANRALADWQNLQLADRLRILLAFRGRLVQYADEIITAVESATQKSRFEILGELMHIGNVIGFLCGNAKRILRPRRVSSWPMILHRAHFEFVPYGVVAVITPWNYPLVLSTVPVLQALTAGNVVIHKPSEFCTPIAELLQGHFSAVCPWPEVWQVLPGDAGSAQLLAAAAVDKISFTGSTVAGRQILRAAADRNTPTVMELSGLDAALVAADAPLQRTAAGVVWSAFLNAGQSCISTRRVFVERQVADQFLSAIRQQLEQIRIGHLQDSTGEIDIRPMNRNHTPNAANRLAHLDQLLADAELKGATLFRAAPSDFDTDDFYPTVIYPAHESMRVMQEESFGPILAIEPVDDLEAALPNINSTPFGLGSSIWIGDRNRGLRLAKQLKSGSVGINDAMVQLAAPALPFGGFGASGFGRTSGEAGLREYCQTKSYIQNLWGARQEFQWFPYQHRHRQLRKYLDLIFAPHWLDRLLAMFRKRTE